MRIQIQFSLCRLFGLVLFAAVGCGLLRFATPLLATLTFTVTVITLTVSVVAAICNTPKRRVFWTGFAAFGFAYLWAICGNWQSPDGSTSVRERLLSSRILDWCYNRLPIENQAEMAASIPEPTSAEWLTSSPVVAPSPFAKRPDFFTVGHS